MFSTAWSFDVSLRTSGSTTLGWTESFSLASFRSSVLLSFSRSVAAGTVVSLTSPAAS